MVGTALAIAGGIAGGIAGAIPKEKKSSVDAGEASTLEQFASGLTKEQLGALTSAINSSALTEDVQKGSEAQRSLADLMKQMQVGGGMPDGADIQRSNEMAKLLFQSQQEALKQSFQGQEQDFARRAALTGRGLTDPVLNRMMAEQQTQQQRQLASEQGSYAAQLAMQQPKQRLALAEARTNVLSGLANQALQNRQTLLNLGSQLTANERNWRLATATRTEKEGGGFGGFLSGALGGLSAGMSAGKAFEAGNIFSQAPAPAAMVGAPAGPSLGNYSLAMSNPFESSSNNMQLASLSRPSFGYGR